MKIQKCPQLLLVAALTVPSMSFLVGCNASSKSDKSKVWTHAELIKLTTSQAVSQIKSGNLKSVELTQALINQAKKHQNLNIFISLDEEGALKKASELDEIYAAGNAQGALFGVPVVLKDNIHAAGLRNTAGTPALSSFIPSENAPTTQALVDAGAIVLGKVNMHELAFGITSDNAEYGAVGNPYKPAYTAGGSSGGSAAALAAGMAVAALGTDTGGSVRIPAALNGVYSLRPTMGRYAQEGVTPISHTRDTVGPLARSVEDLIILDSVITGENELVPSKALNTLRIGVPRSYYYENLDPEMAAAAEGVIQTLRDAGASLVEVDMLGVAELNEKVGFPVVLYEAVEGLTRYLDIYNTGVTFSELAAMTASPDVSGLFSTLTTVDENKDGVADGLIPESVYQDAIRTYRPALQALFQSYYDDHQLDAMLIPTTPLPSRKTEGLLTGVELNGEIVNTFGTYIRNTDPDSNAGLPGVAFPVALNSEGLPMGMQLGGPAHSDRALLAIAMSVTAALPMLPAPDLD